MNRWIDRKTDREIDNRIKQIQFQNITPLSYTQIQNKDKSCPEKHILSKICNFLDYHYVYKKMVEN